MALGAIGAGGVSLERRFLVARLAIIDSRHQDVARLCTLKDAIVARFAIEHTMTVVAKHAMLHPTIGDSGRLDIPSHRWAGSDRLDRMAVLTATRVFEKAILGFREGLVNPRPFFLRECRWPGSTRYHSLNRCRILFLHVV